MNLTDAFLIYYNFTKIFELSGLVQKVGALLCKDGFVFTIKQGILKMLTVAFNFSSF